MLHEEDFGVGDNCVTERVAKHRARAEAYPTEIHDRKIGRHVVIEEIGRGGMGEVYLAYDPKLQREVALKRLRRKPLGNDGKARFEQEARAMAKLSHPNVVSVYDVESLDNGQLVLVMEYVSGPTLRNWLRTPRPWRDVLAQFLDAGRGLAAAHRAGLLHRDFKPANVLVSHDVAKVTDFGIAKRAKDASGSLSFAASGELPGEADEEDLTREGEVLGTPRYMAPEQHRGNELTEAVDQFAFCVALWEALTQSAPYAGEGLAKQKHEGPPQWPTSCGPRWLGDALRRGLAPRPEERWTGMHELLGVLSEKLHGRHKRWIWLVGAAGLAGVTGVSSYYTQSSGPSPCSGAELQLERQWGQAARASVREGLTSIDVGYAASVWERADHRLDTYAAAWVDSYRSACEASARKEQSEAMMDLRVGCLDRGKQSLGAIVEALGKADAEVLRNADSMLDTLPDLERCSNIAALQESTRPPAPSEVEAVRKARAAVAAANVARIGGDQAESTAQLARARALVDAVEYGPLRTEFQLARAELLLDQGDWTTADEALRSALRSAVEVHDWENTARAAAGLINTVGGGLGRPNDVLILRNVAESAAKGSSLLEAEVHSAISNALLEASDLEGAEHEARAALQKRIAELGAEHRRVASSRNNLGGVLRHQGRYQEAEDEFRVVITMLTESLGPDHPSIAVARNNLASLLHVRGRLQEAEAEIRLAQSVRKRSLGERHLLYGAGKLTLADILADARRIEEATTEAREGRAIIEAAVGGKHIKAGLAANTVGRIMIRSGRAREAEEAFRQYLEVLREIYGNEHPVLGNAYMNLAVAMRHLDELEEAERTLLETERIWTSAYGANHANLQGLHNNLGNLYLDMKRFEEARASFERSLEIGALVLDPDDPVLLDARGSIADALVELGDLDRAEAERRYVVERLAAERSPDDPKLAIARSRLAELLLRRAGDEEALTLATAAHTQGRADGLSAAERGEITMTLAESMEAASGKSVRVTSRARAEDALQFFAQAGPGGRSGVERARAWLRTHPP